jgi:hypothetical protein
MAIQPPTYTNFLAYSSDEATYWNSVVVADGTTKVSCVPSALGGSIVQTTFSRVEATGVREDVALFTLHLAVATGSNNAWSRLNSSDAASVETQMDTLWSNMATYFTSHWALSGYVWRHFGADFPKGKTGLSKPGPIWRITSRSTAGSAVGGTLTDQTAETVTWRTASRRHWGRIYLPAIAATNLTVNSRLTPTAVDFLSARFDAAFGALNGLSRNIHPFVWNSKNPGMFSVAQLAMDDVPDVIRRRRPKQRTYLKTYP